MKQLEHMEDLDLPVSDEEEIDILLGNDVEVTPH